MRYATKIQRTCCPFIAVVQIVCAGSMVHAAGLTAGVARIDLTPPLEMQATLGGYGARASRPAEGVHDRVFAKALVLTDGTRRFALVTADVLGFPPPVKRAVVGQLATDGWTGRQIMLLPSHSHTSIDLQRIELPERTAHSEFMQTGGKEYGLKGAILDTLLATLVPAATSSGCLRLGDLVIVGVPGELAAELGLEIKRQTAAMTAATCPTIGGLANEWISYILPRAEYEQGGYEASVSFYGSSLGETIVDGVLAGVQSLGVPETQADRHTN